MKHDVCPNCGVEINPFSEYKIHLNIFNIAKMKKTDGFWYCSEGCLVNKLSSYNHSKVQELFPFTISSNIVKTFLKSEISGEYTAIVDL